MQTPTNSPPVCSSDTVVVVAASVSDVARAAAVASELNLEQVRQRVGGSIHLVVGEADVWLETTEGRTSTEVHLCFDSAAMMHRRRGGHNELLGRAVGVKADRLPRVFDATGGLGRDAFVMADLGCEVTISERSPVLAWLLDDAISRARISVHESVRLAAQRMSVVQGDSVRRTLAGVSVIYLDPMFPERKKSAAVRKDAAMLQRLAGGEPDPIEPLLAWALSQNVARVVVKQPRHASAPPGRKPSHSISGKSVRFDVFVQQTEALNE
jgi:16S rRNA (guanine1516-N2)-methyltransferase